MNQYQELPSFQPFAYEVQSLNLIEGITYCQAIAINNQNKFIIVASNTQIKLLLFKKGIIKQLTSIKKHKMYVQTLQFFNFNSNFVSGSQSLIIWSLSHFNLKIFIKINWPHQTNFEFGITPSKITHYYGSFDTTIRFWLYSQVQQYNQIINEHQDQVLGLTINKEGNKLISCGKDKIILVIEQVKNNYTPWQVRQKIQVNQFGYRVCFINSNSFAFLPLSFSKSNIIGTDLLYIYTPDSLGFYSKQKEFQVAGGGQTCYNYFPSIYTSKKEILVIKNGYMVSILRMNEQYLNQKQYIFFDCTQFYQGMIIGTMTEDGEYLLIWDAQSCNIQVRQYMEKI